MGYYSTFNQVKLVLFDNDILIMYLKLYPDYTCTFCQYYTNSQWHSFYVKLKAAFFLLICGARSSTCSITPINWPSPPEQWYKFLNYVYNTYSCKWHKHMYMYIYIYMHVYIYNHASNPGESNHSDGLRAIKTMLLRWRQQCLGYQIILLWIW